MENFKKYYQSKGKSTFLFEICQGKAEYQRTDAFELWCWRKLLYVYISQGISRIPGNTKICEKNLELTAP